MRFKFYLVWFLSVLFTLGIYSCTIHAQESDYRLGSGDTIRITVYGEDDLTRVIKVGKTGKLTFPFLDELIVLGKTTKELAAIIDKGLRGDYLINPQVSVSIENYRPFFIHGEVAKPGGYSYQDGLTIDKAIAIAGGLTSRASKSNWLINRKINGKLTSVSVNIDSVVQPDDIIKIEQSFF